MSWRLTRQVSPRGEHPIPRSLLAILSVVVCAASFGALASPAGDRDGDGVPDAIDCHPLDPTVWRVPSEAPELTVGAGGTSFTWSPSNDPGGAQTVLYDLIRSTDRANFSSATCVASDVTGTSATDPAVPGSVFYYLLRSKNGCGGNLGSASSGVPRTGVSCEKAGGSACVDAGECAGGGCCGGVCVDLGADIGNCGACGDGCDDADACTNDLCGGLASGCRHVDVNACATPSCALSACAVDLDGDGLSDAWETNGYVDVNCNGAFDPATDLALPGADPHKPDIYVYYDWMDYGPDDEPCVTSSNCASKGKYHRGEICNGVGQCVYACTTDLDCTTGATGACSTDADCASGSVCDSTGQCARGSWHSGERCIDNICEHTHDPLALEPNTFTFVVDRFAAHGINLHILRGRAQPHSHVVSYRSDAQMDLNCEGGSLGAGSVGPGKHAVSFYDLKGASNPDRLLDAYHYALFGHFSGCDRGHCPATRGDVSDCPNTTMTSGQAGTAELAGNDLTVSLGGLINNAGLSPHFEIAVTFMHELGHNLGMRHDGHKDEPCDPNGGFCPAGDTCSEFGDGQGPVCHETVNGTLGEEEPNYKPNYISIMNYMYERNAIHFAAAVGSTTQVPCVMDSDCAGYGAECSSPPLGVCVRIDYSGQTLPTGGATPGALDESNLDDTVGLGSGTADLFNYVDGTCHLCPQTAPTTGPVDWVGAGLANNPQCLPIGPQTYTFTDTGVHADIDRPSGACDSSPHDVLHGHTDWPDVGGLPFVYKFMCNPNAAN